MNELKEKQDEIRVKNSMIADFLGWEKVSENKYRVPNLFPIYNIDDEENTGWLEDDIFNCPFHSDWNWIMYVLEKICRLKIGDGVEKIDYAYPRTFGMLEKSKIKKSIMVRLNGHGLFMKDNLIDAVYESVVDFCKYYKK